MAYPGRRIPSEGLGGLRGSVAIIANDNGVELKHVSAENMRKFRSRKNKCFTVVVTTGNW